MAQIKKVKIKSLGEVTTKKAIVDLRGWTVPKGTTLHIINNTLPRHPSKGYQLIVTRVDNGTGMLELMPESIIKDTDLK